MSQIPLPVTNDPDSRGFFEAASEGRLVIRKCNSCGSTIHLPISVCDRCHSWDLQWQEVRPAGILYTFTTSERQVHPAFPAPYTVVLVELEDDPTVRFVGWMDGAPELEIGMAMHGWFESLTDDVSLLRWAAKAGQV